ncbi:MAG: GntR family transcriptional regulator [Treponema sp.]|nr:GntR family transcriptional regulator [Treponema sp.]
MKNPTTKVFEALKQEIVSGVYPPLAPLSEVRLASLYGASRNTVKKALLMLEKENLVSIELNKGAKVKSVSIDEVKEFLELRVVLERFIVGKTVPVISPDDIAEMEKILERMKKNIHDRDLLEYSKNNLLFHDVIYTACPNRVAVEITTNLKVQMRRYNSKTILVPGRDSCSFQEHSAILAAFKKRDVAQAELLIQQHILNVKKAFEDNLSLIF